MTSTLELVQPTYHWAPERRGSYGEEAIDLAELAGLRPDAEQQLAVDTILSFKAGGRWLTLEQAFIEARQNGKTTNVLEIVTMFDLWMLPPDRIVWTAQLFKTAREAFEDFDRMIAATPELSRRVKKINYSHGDESIELHHPKSHTLSGAVLDFLARSQASGRGLGGKRVVMDEALFLTSGPMGSLMPVLSARPDPQITYGSSAGLPKSDHLRKLRNRGRAGGDPSLIYVEYCAPGSWKEPPCEQGIECSHLYGVPGCALDNEEHWKLANHTLGRRITYDYVRAERRTLDPLEFGRERMGWWQDPPEDGEADGAVDMARWSLLADPQAPAPDGSVALALEVAPDRTSTAVGVAWGAPGVEGRVMVMVTVLPGTSRAVALIERLVDEHDVVDVSLHGGGPAGSLVGPLEVALGNSWMELRVVSTQEAAQATGAFVDLIAEPLNEAGNPTGEKLLGHLDQAELNDSLTEAKLRITGDAAQLWDSRDSNTLAPTKAVTLAANGYVKHGQTPFFGGAGR